jgi:hypothetical protein
MKMFSIFSKKTGISLLVTATFVLSVAAVLFGQAGMSDQRMWQATEERSLDQTAKRVLVPAVYRTVRLDQSALAQALTSAPMEYTRVPSQNPIIYLPMPNGTMARFRYEESPIMEAGLAAKYPALKTYRAQGVDDPTATSRFDWLPSGFHAIILSSSGTVLIDPYAQGNTTDYITYWKNDAANLAGDFKCHFVNPEGPELAAGGGPVPAVTSGTQMRTYRLALACTVEYATVVGSNTVAGALAAEVLIMNRVNGVYEREVAIHYNIIANNNLITYAADNLSCGGACTTANDPYTNDNGSTMLGQNNTNINAVIGAANYDIGHVFSTGGGGIAQLGVVCGGSKAGGVTGLSNPVGDPFAIDYVAHEMGHQWSALHPFNGTSGSCGGGNRSNSAAYEVGSGITIMAYAGICAPQDLAAHSIDNFHVKSLEQIVAYSQTGAGNGCAATTATGNTPPTVTGTGNFTIPKKTPFSLTAAATDPNGDSLTYDWEEYDLDAGGTGTTATPNTDADGIPRAIFRPYAPTIGGTRTFPALQYILNNANVPPTFTGGFLTGELLPAISRAMVFKVTARDNRAGGGGINTAAANTTITVDGASGPFAVTHPNSGNFQVGTNLNVTWDVAGTAGAPVNAANVKISLSTDGGNTFPTVLSASTANDGTESFVIPNSPTSTARVKVEAVGNIFFDISDQNFGITTTAPSPTPTPTPSAPPSPTPSCTPGWAPGAALPAVGGTRAVGIYFTNGRFYTMGGRSSDTAGNNFTNPFEYNPVTNTWATKAGVYPDVNVNNMACGTLTVSGTPQIYCVGGSAGGGTTATARVFSYNPATDVVTSLTGADDWPGSPGGAAATILPGGFAVAGNKLYIIGGFNIGTGSTAQVWQFDPTAAIGSRWLQRADLPLARSYVPAATLGGIIYTGGGSNIVTTTVTDAQESFKYDPAANTWTAITSIPRATGETRAVVMNGQMWVLGGGRTAPNPSNEVDIYTPGTDSWSVGVPFTTARRNFPADSDGTTHVYLTGGYDTSGTALLNTTEVFGPVLCVSPTPGTPTPTATATATATATVAATATATATATAAATATATVAATPTPSSTPPSQATNLSTRMKVLTGDNVAIGGFIITGTVPKPVLLRAIGPSLTAFGVPGALADPVLELHGPSGFTTITNDNWRDDPVQQALIIATGIPPSDNLESAIVATLAPGNYTGIVSGKNNTTGVALIEVYDLTPSVLEKLGNISTRAFVDIGDNVVIAGFILGNSSGNDNVIIRGIGPSLTLVGVPNAMANPTLELHNNSGTLVASNDNWQDDPSQAAILNAAGLGLNDASESGIAATLGPGLYTAILAGQGNGTGVGLVEVYDRGNAGGGGGASPTPGTPTPTPPGITPTPTPPGATPTPSPTPSPSGPCVENFDGVTAPALPPGFVASNPTLGDGVMWVTETTTPDAGPNDAYVPDQDGVSDKVLDSRNITINSASAVLTFRNNYNTEYDPPPAETFWDGGVLEVSSPNIAGGAFTDVTDPAVGGTITAGDYTGEIDGTAGNPLAGRRAWCGNSGGYINTAINLGSNVNGQTIKLRFRMGSDEAASRPGWRVDTISITNASCP